MKYLLGTQAISVFVCGVCLLGFLQRGHVGTVFHLVQKYLRGWEGFEGWWGHWQGRFWPQYGSDKEAQKLWGFINNRGLHDKDTYAPQLLEVSTGDCDRSSYWGYWGQRMVTERVSILLRLGAGARLNYLDSTKTCHNKHKSQLTNTLNNTKFVLKY